MNGLLRNQWLPVALAMGLQACSPSQSASPAPASTVQQSVSDDEASLRTFLARFAELYNEKAFSKLDGLVSGSDPVILIESWAGETPNGTAHRSLGELFASVDWNSIQPHVRMGQNPWKWGNLTRGGYCGDVPAEQRIAWFGATHDKDLLTQWNGIKIWYTGTPNDEHIASTLSGQITHFAWDGIAMFGLFLAQRPQGWQVIAVDMVDLAC